MAVATRIALFGGTFDPVHLGHLSMAQRAHDQLSLSEVRFLPCRISPHKQQLPPSPAEARLQMLRLATEDQPWAVVDDSELHREGPSYSWRTAEDMQQRFPENRLFWIMGSDQWEVLETWDRPDRLAELVEFVVVARGAAPRPRPGCLMHVLADVHPASASQIRDELVRGAQEHPWLDPKVASYIQEQGLYQATC